MTREQQLESELREAQQLLRDWLSIESEADGDDFLPASPHWLVVRNIHAHTSDIVGRIERLLKDRPSALRAA